ncbi:ABC transporter permease subunit [Neobacillus sp. D3-1R]|uniref:ABC transporter permease subunit n=1 Tax=Neobacillus sp. D3-1R TaxID=3445778 RepID=UPI003F9F18D8
MNIFLYEWKAYRKSTIIWSIVLLTLVVLFMSMFPSISKDAVQYKKLLEGYPEGVRKAIGLNIDSFFSLLGFYSYSFLYITLCGAIQAMNLGVSIVSKEVREKTADFLLTKPVTRSSIITSKVMAALTALLVTNIVFIIGSSLVASQVKVEDFSKQAFFLISLTLLFTQFIFFALGLVLSILMKKIKSVITVSLGTVFFFFIIAMLSSTSGDGVERYLSPFKFFDTAYIIKHSSYELSFLITGIVIMIVSIFTSYLVYIKKDIHTA